MKTVTEAIISMAMIVLPVVAWAQADPLPARDPAWGWGWFWILIIFAAVIGLAFWLGGGRRTGPGPRTH